MSSNKNSKTTSIEKIHVGPRTLFTPGARQLVKVGTRNIAVVEHKGHLYAIDNACYHHGGPLLNGDIEDMGGHPCIVCPWHSYRIALDTGEGLYVGIDVVPGGKKPVPAVRSKGCKQRVHKVVCDDGEVFVLLDLNGPAIESDTYANMAIANQEGAMAAPREGGGGGRSLGLHSGLRSGQVFQHMSRDRDGIPNPFSTAPQLPVKNRDSRNHSPVPGLSPDLTVSCFRIVQVSDGVKELYFNRADGTILRLGQPGEYIELELPLKEKDGSPMRRKWTICEINKKGALFTLLIKAHTANPGGGSMWMHSYALHSPLQVSKVDGHFTHAYHARHLRALQGNVLWLTAGIGISSAFAVLNTGFNEDLAVMPPHACDPLHALHLHVDHTVEAVAKLEELVDLQHRYADLTAAHTYQLYCYITRQQLQLRAANKAAAAQQQQQLDSYLTYGRRMTAADIAARTQSYFGEGVRFLTFVCGPPEFVNDCTNTLLTMGVSEEDILTDDP